MEKSAKKANGPEGLYQSNGRRKLLIIDAQPAERDLLEKTLREEYELFFAENERQALDLIHEQREYLSLILLDPDLPEHKAPEVLQQIKKHPTTKNIPVLALTSGASRQNEYLEAGILDFFSRPLPPAKVILNRIRSAIELSEDRRIIRYTERDPLTGLYHPDYFYGYALRYEQFHPDRKMDAIALDIGHFSLVNECCGRASADEILKQIGGLIRDAVHDDDGIVCRCGVDLFYVFCPHREDYESILEYACKGLDLQASTGGRVKLRMGVYPNVDRTLPIEQRFARAKMAADTVRDNLTRSIGFYDEELHEAHMRDMRLIDSFQKALRQEQFVVFYQPKISIRSDQPVLEGAEALVRWDHPELGLILPDEFIPLLESHGLVHHLDRHVWEIVARQIRSWKDQYGFSVPVSVNLSRIDLYEPNLVYILLRILEENQLDAGDLHLEIAESVYAEDPDQIADAIKRLHAIGFTIEMDDFGTAASSLQAMTTLPIDVLKLDMISFRTAFAQEKHIQTLEMMMEIARDLSVTVVSERVESEEQLQVLQRFGCEIIQGYFVSPPVEAKDFEVFLKDTQQLRIEASDTLRDYRETLDNAVTAVKKESRGSRISNQMSHRYNIPLRNASMVFILVTFIAAICLFISNSMVTHGYEDMDQASDSYILAEQATTNMEIGSDFLTEQARLFVMLGDIKYLNNYFKELNQTKRRDQAVEDVESLLQGRENAAYEHLSAALRLSNDLVDMEYHAMKLVLESGNYDMERIPKQLRDYELSEDEREMTDDEKRAKARQLVLGPEYMEQKAQISASTAACARYLISTSDQERIEANQRMSRLLTLQTLFIVILLLIVLCIAVFLSVWVRKPLSRMVTLMKAKETVPPAGAAELRFVSETYNMISEENQRSYRRLTYGKMHDSLTGLYNRYAFNIMRQDIDMTHHALVLLDVDQFRSVNDTYGHDVGDRILQRVTQVLSYQFRAADMMFRVGGDEFAVLMPAVDPSMRDQVESRIEQTGTMLQQPEDDLPPVTLTAGIAFADPEHAQGDLFSEAEAALQEAAAPAAP